MGTSFTAKRLLVRTRTNEKLIMPRMVKLAVSVGLLLPFWFSLSHKSESASTDAVGWFHFLPYSSNWLIGMIVPSLALSLICIGLVSTPVRTRATRILKGGPYLSVLTLTLAAWIFVVTEVGLRSVIATRTPSPLHVGMNYLGYRGPVLPLGKPEGTTYVAAIGGSTTYGSAGVDWWEAWPAYFETFLNAESAAPRGRRFRVANLGLEGAGLDCGIRRFRHFSRFYEFDALVVHAGYNGVGDWCQYWLPIGTKPRDVSLLIRLVTDFLEGRELYVRSIERLHTVLGFGDKDNIDGQLGFHELYLDFVDSLLRKGVLVVAIRQPASDSSLAGSEMRYPDKAEELEKRLTARGDRLGLELLERFSGAQGFALVDLHDVNLDGLRADSIHLVPEGNKMIARIIAREFLEGYVP